MPNLPTDNLYKFLALGGIALIGISLFATEKALDRTYERVLAAQESQWPELLELAALDRRVNEAWLEVLMNVPGADSLMGLDVGSAEAPRDPAWSDSMLAVVMGLRLDLSSRSDLTEARLEVTRTRASQAEDALRRARTVYGLSVAALVLGFVSALAGFALWYVRVQRYQDEMAVMQRDQARAELWRGQRDLL